MKHSDEYRDRDIAGAMITDIKTVSRKPVRLMEVCGTHTVSIFRSGIRSVLPDTISLISGPGCPVCVTAQHEIDMFIALSNIDDIIITTFGDLMRVPGSASSLQKQRAEGKDIRVVYSTVDALEIAMQHPEKEVVFLGVGFETTTPTVAAAIQTAENCGIGNFSVCSAHKLVPPALDALVGGAHINIDGFLLPGHVSVITGENAYLPFVGKHGIPCVITGFEPVDILRGISNLVGMLESGAYDLYNAYERVVTPEGNKKAMDIMHRVFEPAETVWRGLGNIPGSGLFIKKTFEQFDARKKFSINVVESEEPKGCACGRILAGQVLPPECPLYKKTCTPVNPVGPCMVSSEGTCAAYYKYTG